MELTKLLPSAVMSRLFSRRGTSPFHPYQICRLLAPAEKCNASIQALANGALRTAGYAMGTGAFPTSERTIICNRSSPFQRL